MAKRVKHVLLDTNVLIEILNGVRHPDDFSGCIVYVSVLTIMELYALAGMSKDEEQNIDRAVEELTMIPLTADIAKRAGVFARTRTKRAGRSDLLIAATAIEYRLLLVTNNVRDFQRIPNLKVSLSSNA